MKIILVTAFMIVSFIVSIPAFAVPTFHTFEVDITAGNVFQGRQFGPFQGSF